MSYINKAGKPTLLLAGASVGLASWGGHHNHNNNKDRHPGAASTSTPRAAKQYQLTSPRGIFAIASPAPAQCEGSSGGKGPKPIFVSTSRKGDRAAVAAESEARLRAKGMLREVVDMWGTSTESDTHPW